jgi:hypothetical protein
VGSLKAERAAADRTANGPQELAHTGKRRGSFATTFSPEPQALARITARVENHIREVESRIIRLGQLVDADEADRDLVLERLGVAVELAGLDLEAPAKHGNCGKPKSPAHRAAIASALKGKPKSPEHRAAIAAALGRRHSAEARALLELEAPR